MKKVFISVFVVCTISCSLKRNEKTSFPLFNLLLVDSSTIFNTNNISTGKPIVFMYFSPDCEHCEESTKSLLLNMNSLRQVQFYLVTTDPFDRLKAFYERNKLIKYPNIVLGRDFKSFFPLHFKTDVVPLLVIYDKRKQLKVAFVGGFDVNKFIKVVHDLQ